MSTQISPLVKNKIDSLEIDDSMKKTLEALIGIEIRLGNNTDVKSVKKKNYREEILKRMPR